MELALEGERARVIVADADVVVAADIEVAAGVPADQERDVDTRAARLAVDEHGAAADAADAFDGEADVELAGCQGLFRHRLQVLAEQVVVEHQPVLVHIEREAAAVVAIGEQAAFLLGRCAFDRGRHDQRAVAELRRRRQADFLERRRVDIALTAARVAPAAGRTPEFGAAVVERQHAVAAGLDPPQVDHLAQFLGVLLGEVVTLREVGVDVIEFPVVVIERGVRLMVGHGLPAVGPDAAVTEHLEILHLLARRRRRGLRRKGVEQAGAVHRHLRMTVDDVRTRRADRLEDGRRNVGDVVELVADAALVADAGRPVRDQRIADAATMGVLLVALVRCVADRSPAPGIVVEAFRRADLVDACDRLFDRLRPAVEIARVVDHAGRAAFLAGAVVGHQQEQRVVEFATGGEVIHQPADLRVGVFEEAGESLLQAQRQRAFIRREFDPGLHARIARRKVSIRRDDAKLLLPLVPLLPHHIPAGVELAAVLVDVFLRRLMRRMRRAERDVEEERLFRHGCLLRVHHADRLIDQVFAEVITLIRRLRRLHRMIVAGQIRTPLVGLAFEEAVVAVEAACERPLVERAGRRCLLHRGEVPLADGEGGVAARPQHFGNRRRALRHGAGAVRIARAPVGEPAHADRMVIAAGHQRGAGR